MQLLSKFLFTCILTIVAFMTIADSKFTSETQLASRLTNEISRFWQQGNFSSFLGVNNTRINYATFIHAESLTPQTINAQPCLVISSGRSESYLKYQELSFDFFNLGYNVFLIDHRGQGLSGRVLANPNKGHVENFQFYVDDLANFIDNVVSNTCIDKPYLLAHSMGGAIAARYLQDHANKIKAAVLSSPMLGFTGGIPDFIANSIIKATAHINQWFDDTPWYFFGHKDFTPSEYTNNPLMHSSLRHQVFAQLYLQTPEIQLGGVTTQWLAASLTGLAKIFNQIDKISTPILVLQAGADSIVDNQAQDRFCQALHQLQPNSCPNGKPLVITGAYHELFFESDVYRTPALNAVATWFKQHP